MRRRTVHLLFASAALAFGAAAGWQIVELRQAEALNRAMAEARVSQGNAGPPQVSLTPSGGGNVEDVSRGRSTSEPTAPEARFARALALAVAGDHEAATKAYQALARGERADLRQAALYNLGNLHLREALKGDKRDAAHALPLIELAKQSYRNALREAPDDWDLRYNLERALWLAPEQGPDAAPEKSPDRERAITTMPRTRIDLP